MALYRIPPWISCSDLTCHNWQWNNFNTVWVLVLHFIRHMSVSNKYVFGYLLDSTWHTLWDTTKTIFRNCVISILYKILPRMSDHCLAFSVPQSNLLESRLMWPWCVKIHATYPKVARTKQKLCCWTKQKPWRYVGTKQKPKSGSGGKKNQNACLTHEIWF